MFIVGTFTARFARVRGRAGWRWGAASTLGATFGSLSFLVVPNGLGYVSFLIGGGVLGHPKVYLEMGDETYVECPYCDRRFVLRAGAQPH